jgi:RsmE family RNA methyltransferase
VNVILLDDGDFVADNRVRLADARARHVRDVLRARVGARLVVGRVGGRLGEGLLLALDACEATLEVVLDRDPPPPSPVTIALALPRPPTLRKVLTQVTSMGVKRIALFHSARVEKSYWNSHALHPDAIEAQLRLGLEQARDTVLPQVELHPRFRPFVEDRLPELAPVLLLADPTGSSVGHPAPSGSSCAVFGPEGGFIPFEFARLHAAGVVCVSLGVRPLRVETAVVALLGRLSAT